jgi:hypothetical protein
MYDSESGRFCSRDPIGYVEGLSLYRSYISLMLVDPTGQAGIWEPRDPRKGGPHPPVLLPSRPPVHYSGQKCVAGEKVTVICAVGPMDALAGRMCASYAWRALELSPYSEGNTGEAPNNNEGDAYRHCVWSCCMARTIGAEQAETITDIHEDCNPNRPEEHEMDQHNNKIGRDVGVSGFDCEKGCTDAVEIGRTINEPDWDPDAEPPRPFYPG